VNETVVTLSWVHWSGNIRKAVAESSQEFNLRATEFEKYPEEIVL
jgi:hypothetical protein